MPEPVISAAAAIDDGPTSGGGIASLRLLGIGAVLVISGVLTNVAFELLSKRQPGCSSLLTMCQYLTALAGGGGGAMLRYVRRCGVEDKLCSPGLDLLHAASYA